YGGFEFDIEVEAIAEITETSIMPTTVHITQQQQQDTLQSLWVDTVRFGGPRAVRMAALLLLATFVGMLVSSLVLGCSRLLAFPATSAGTVTVFSELMVVELGRAEGSAASAYGVHKYDLYWLCIPFLDYAERLSSTNGRVDRADGPGILREKVMIGRIFCISVRQVKAEPVDNSGADGSEW
ncbi:1068_t:CDS:2, partial [Acaulospora colombiana]